MKTNPVITAEYVAFIAELKARIQNARINAARAVNRDLILLYWDIGCALAEKQQQLGWGEAVVERLAADLRHAFPDLRGFSSDNVWRMRQFYREYSAPDFLEQVVREIDKPSGRRVLEQAVPEITSGEAPCHGAALPARGAWELLASVPWGHHVLLIKKIKDPAARIYYLRATARFGWSRAVLLNQIKAGAYERAVTDKKTHNFPLALPEYLAEQADEMLKSSYNLEFLGIRRPLKERELEDRLIARLHDFILELGYGFCFIGRQYRLALGDQEYFVDLLFYHRFLKALVAFDLKIAEFQPEHAGKMDFYLNLLNENERGPGDQPSIGIILCAEKNNLAVEFALKSKTNPIGVAEYQLQPRLPSEYKGKLPSAKQLADAMRPVLPALRTAKSNRTDS